MRTRHCTVATRRDGHVSARNGLPRSCTVVHHALRHGATRCNRATRCNSAARCDPLPGRAPLYTTRCATAQHVATAQPVATRCAVACLRAVTGCRCGSTPSHGALPTAIAHAARCKHVAAWRNVARREPRRRSIFRASHRFTSRSQCLASRRQARNCMRYKCAINAPHI